MSWAKSLGAGGARRQIEGEIGALGNADLLADEIIDLEPQAERLGRIGRPGRDGKDHLILIAEGIEAEEGEAAGHRPGEIGAGEIGRSRPIQAHRNAGIARRAPIGLPAGRQLELQPERHRFGAAAAGDGARPAGAWPGPWRPNRRPRARRPSRRWRPTRRPAAAPAAGGRKKVTKFRFIGRDYSPTALPGRHKTQPRPSQNRVTSRLVRDRLDTQV